jgi:hypothetical protein
MAISYDGFEPSRGRCGSMCVRNPTWPQAHTATLPEASATKKKPLRIAPAGHLVDGRLARLKIGPRHRFEHSPRGFVGHYKLVAL